MLVYHSVRDCVTFIIDNYLFKTTSQEIVFREPTVVEFLVALRLMVND